MSSSIILVTGGNTGIGYETVKTLYASSQPYTVLMGSRSLEKAEASIAKLKSEFPESKNEVLALQVDIEDDESIERAFKEVQEKWGRLDGLVNNAGAYISTIPSPKCNILNTSQAPHSMVSCAPTPAPKAYAQPGTKHTRSTSLPPR